MVRITTEQQEERGKIVTDTIMSPTAINGGLLSFLALSLRLGGWRHRRSALTEIATMNRRTTELPKFPNPRFFVKYLSRAKSRLGQMCRPGLAQLFLAWLGLASGLKPKPAHHYSSYTMEVKILSGG